MDKPIRGPALNRAIQDHIKYYITENHLGPGDALPPETQLAQDLGVSRGSVREAVKALASLGIVEVRHGNGVFVRDFNFDSIFDLLSYGLIFDRSRIVDILQIRKWLEAAAIGEVVERITENEIKQIEEVLARRDEKAARNEPTTEEDRAFHRLLYSVLGNQSLIALIDIFWLVYYAVRIKTITYNPRTTVTLQDHREVFYAVRDRDAALARQRIQEHFRDLENRVKEAGFRK
jgi:DNA-binding FadR family transcriptional regulator